MKIATAIERTIPICMTGESIWALLLQQKSQTRRLIAPQPVLTEHRSWLWKKGKREAEWSSSIRNPRSMLQHIRFRKGDKLWVREGWASSEPGLVAYRSTLECGRWVEVGGGRDWKRMGDVHGDDPRLDQPDRRYVSLDKFGRWRSPRFMPKWAARFYLRVEDVRVEQLLDITEQDAKAEGAHPMFIADARFIQGGCIPKSTHRHGFQIAWDEINGKNATFDSNPWVAVVTFKEITGEAFR